MNCFECTGIPTELKLKLPPGWLAIVSQPQCHKHWAEHRLEWQVGTAMEALRNGTEAPKPPHGWMAKL